MELAYKEDLFMILSMNMEVEDALRETERISNNFKKIYSPKPSHLQPIVGNDTYRYYCNELMNSMSFNSYWESRVDKYINGKWEIFMRFTDIGGDRKCKQLVERLKLGGNTVIEF